MVKRMKKDKENLNGNLILLNYNVEWKFYALEL